MALKLFMKIKKESLKLQERGEVIKNVLITKTEQMVKEEISMEWM